MSWYKGITDVKIWSVYCFDVKTVIFWANQAFNWDENKHWLDFKPQWPPRAPDLSLLKQAIYTNKIVWKLSRWGHYGQVLHFPCEILQWLKCFVNDKVITRNAFAKKCDIFNKKKYDGFISKLVIIENTLLQKIRYY